MLLSNVLPGPNEDLYSSDASYGCVMSVEVLGMMFMYIREEVGRNTDNIIFVSRMTSVRCLCAHSPFVLREGRGLEYVRLDLTCKSERICEGAS